MLGALIEKQLTTPDIYPLTLKALTAACNQTSNRDPVMTIEPLDVETTVLVLKTKGLARVVHPGSGERSTRYRQVADEVLGLDEAERAAAVRAAPARRADRRRAADPHRAPAPVLVARGASRAPSAGWPTGPSRSPPRLERRAGQKEDPAGSSCSRDDPYIPEGPSPGRPRGRSTAAGARADRLAELEAESSDWRPRSRRQSALGDTDT